MGQKTNPISLRLNINRHFDSCWFQDQSFEYSKLLQQDLKIREYVKSLFHFVGLHTGRISVQIFPKKLVLHYFFHEADRKSKKLSALRAASRAKKYKTNAPLQSSVPSFQNTHIENGMRIESREDSTHARGNMSMKFPKALFMNSHLLSSSEKRKNSEKNLLRGTLLSSTGVIDTKTSGQFVRSTNKLVLTTKKNVILNFITPYAKDFQQSTLTPSHSGESALSRPLVRREGVNTYRPVLRANTSASHIMSLQEPKEFDSREVLRVTGNEQGLENGIGVRAKKRFFLRLLFAYYYFSRNQNFFQLQNFFKYSYSASLGLNAAWLEAPLSEKSATTPRYALEGFAPNTCPRIGELFPLQKSFALGANAFQSIREHLPVDIHLKHIESILTKHFQMKTSLVPLKVSSRAISAQLICLYICQRLQQNVPFRQIYKQLLGEMGLVPLRASKRPSRSAHGGFDHSTAALGSSQGSDNTQQILRTDSMPMQSDFIQGMRIVCSGRLGGVEMARVESKKYGQTSLHVFSNHIDFAVDQAYTLFGLIGVKVWICYRESP